MTELFHRCPSCRRRFHVKLESKKLTGLTRKTLPADEPHRVVNQFRGQPVVMVQGETRPKIIDQETFQHNYKCSRCGHEWLENKIEEKREY